MAKNPPARAGDTESLPGPGSSHMHKATQSMQHNYGACALGPRSHNN